MRSACVFGLNGMILQKKFAPELEGIVAKTACGAIEHVPVASVTNLSRTLQSLQDEGFYVIGLDERGEKTISEVDIPKVKNKNEKDDKDLLLPPDPQSAGNGKRIVIVLGSEGSGLRRLIQENCDSLARLPASGPIKSLNVSNAAAVAFYAISRC